MVGFIFFGGSPCSSAKHYANNVTVSKPKKCVQFCNNIYDKGMPYSNCASLFSKDSLEEKGGVKYAIAVGAAL